MQNNKHNVKGFIYFVTRKYSLVFLINLRPYFSILYLTPQSCELCPSQGLFQNSPAGDLRSISTNLRKYGIYKIKFMLGERQNAGGFDNKS